MPLPIGSLRVTTPTKFVDQSPAPDQYGNLHEFLPAALPKEGMALFPRAIVSWSADEVADGSEYIFLERQTEQEFSAMARGPDPEWAMLKAIQSSPVGAPWDPKYAALESWLLGNASPSPGDEISTGEHPASFFPIDGRAAWTLKMLKMQRGSLTPNFIDYFDKPPREGGSSVIMGEERVRGATALTGCWIFAPNCPGRTRRGRSLRPVI